MKSAVNNTIHFTLRALQVLSVYITATKTTRDFFDSREIKLQQVNFGLCAPKRLKI